MALIVGLAIGVAIGHWAIGGTTSSTTRSGVQPGRVLKYHQQQFEPERRYDDANLTQPCAKGAREDCRCDDRGMGLP